MNKTFKVVFNKARGALMVVNEATSSVQKKGTKTVIAAAVATMIAGVSQASILENTASNPVFSKFTATITDSSAVVFDQNGTAVTENITVRNITDNADNGYSNRFAIIGISDYHNSEITKFGAINITASAVYNQTTDQGYDRLYAIAQTNGKDVSFLGSINVSFDITNYGGTTRLSGYRSDAGGKAVFDGDVKIKISDNGSDYDQMAAFDVWSDGANADKGNVTFNKEANLIAINKTNVSNGWTNALKIGSAATVTFNNDATLVAVGKNYTSQSVQIVDDGEISFNGDNTYIISTSGYGANGVAFGISSSNNKIRFTGRDVTIASIVSGDKLGATNAIGISANGDDGFNSILFEETVNNLNVYVYGSGEHGERNLFQNVTAR